MEIVHDGIGMKKIDNSAHIGDSGIALIHQMVNRMGFVWLQRNLDAGIDGEIELRDPATGEVANRLILVQSKASDRPFRVRTTAGFTTCASRRTQRTHGDRPDRHRCRAASGTAWLRHR